MYIKGAYYMLLQVATPHANVVVVVKFLVVE
jgi:hypothetical protein